MLHQIPEIAASTGVACHAGSTEPSSVLLEMGLSREWVLGAILQPFLAFENQAFNEL